MEYWFIIFYVGKDEVITMHIGFQTISFGTTLKNQGRDMFMAISQLGYEGVEIAQIVSSFNIVLSS